MPRPTRRTPNPTKPLVRTPNRIGHLDAAALVGRLRQLHEDAEDKDVERMPDDDELFRALLYLESHTGALKDTTARKAAAIERVRLWEYLREQVDLHQSRAIADARAADVQWRELAPALAVNTSSAAYNKASRLKAASLTDASLGELPVRRTPEAVAEAERKLAARAAAERQTQHEATRRHSLLAPVAQRLLDHRAGLSDDDEVTYWLDEIAEVLPHCETPTQKVALSIYLGAAVRELKRVEKRTEKPATTNAGARLAYAAAVDLFP